MQIENLIQKYIAENLLFSGEGFEYSNDASFLQEGIVDSMGVMELVTFVSGTFGIQIDPAEVLLENFDSVNKLAAFIRRAQGAKRQVPELETVAEAL
jgi:acyl carrier protein